MKYIPTYAFFLMLAFCISCRGQSKPDLPKKNTSSEPKGVSTSRWIDNTHEYTDAAGKSLIIQNSFPKGGLRYTDPKGKVFVYAIFWTQITNKTADPFTLTIDFPADSFELASSPGRYFRLFLPSDTITPEKEQLFNYGLSPLASFLDEGLQKASSLKKTIHPNESGSFYVVTLFNRGVDGTLRTGLSLKGQDLFYRINDKEIQCGKIDLKGITLKK